MHHNCTHYFVTFQILFTFLIHVENFFHMTICHVENFSTWQSVIWTNFSTWQFFLHGIPQKEKQCLFCILGYSQGNVKKNWEKAVRLTALVVLKTRKILHRNEVKDNFQVQNIVTDQPTDQLTHPKRSPWLWKTKVKFQICLQKETHHRWHQHCGRHHQHHRVGAWRLPLLRGLVIQERD